MDAQVEWEGRLTGAEKLAKPRPSLVEVLRMQDPADVEGRLALLPKQRQRSLKLAEGLVNVVREKLGVVDHYYAGSFARGTALNYNFDVDVVLFLGDFNPEVADEYHQKCRNVLENDFYRGAHIVPGSWTPFCTKVTAGGFLKLDVVITGDPYEPDGEYYMQQCQDFIRYYSGAGSEEVDKSFVKFAIKHSKYTPLVLLCKHWKHLDVRSKAFSSYHIELLCQGVVCREEAGHRLQDLFRKFLQRIVDRRTTVRNPNRYNPRVALRKEVAPDLEQYASETLEEFWRYIRPGNNSSCPLCKEQRFTSHVGAVQHLESGSCTGCRGQQNARKAIYDVARRRPETQGLLNRMLTDGGSGSSDYGGNLYACPQCGRTFRQMSSLLDHLSAKHGRVHQAMLALGF